MSGRGTHNIQAAEGLKRKVDQSFDLLLLSDIAGLELASRPKSLRFADHVLAGAVLEIADNHVEAVFGKAHSYGPTDASRGTGNYGDFLHAGG
jgi:hypothetical protein